MESRGICCTDHEALKWLQTQRYLNKRQARWLTVLAEFDFEIQYRPGKQNVLADAMSRPPRELHQVSILVAASSVPSDLR